MNVVFPLVIRNKSATLTSISAIFTWKISSRVKSVSTFNLLHVVQYMYYYQFRCHLQLLFYLFVCMFVCIFAFNFSGVVREKCEKKETTRGLGLLQPTAIRCLFPLTRAGDTRGVCEEYWSTKLPAAVNFHSFPSERQNRLCRLCRWMRIANRM